MRRNQLEHQFVKSFPRPLVDGVLYVSMEYASSAHKCCCGCGNDVHTRLSPKDWRLTFDGRSVTLHPSIGNWEFPCQSHYWIKQDRIVWDEKWPKWRIDELRRQEEQNSEESAPAEAEHQGWWQRLKNSFRK